MKAATMTQEEIRGRISQLGVWFHNMNLGGVPTAPEHFLGDYPAVKWENLQTGIPQDLRGKSVLDIGCNGGFYSIEMKRRGAARVVAIDTDERYLEQAKFAAQMSDTEIEFRQMDVYDTPKLQEKFDFVLFMGVLYHLRHPLLALDLLYEHVVGDTLVFQSLLRGSPKVATMEKNPPFEDREIFLKDGFPCMYFVEERYADDPTNWWIPNRACVEAMLRSSGFTIVAQPEDEAYVCTRNSVNG